MDKLILSLGTFKEPERFRCSLEIDLGNLPLFIGINTTIVTPLVTLERGGILQCTFVQYIISL